MSSDAEGDCSTVTDKPKLPREVWLLVARERRGGAGLRRGRPGAAAVRPPLRRQHQRGDVRHHRVRGHAAGRRAAGRMAGPAAGGAPGLHQRSADRRGVHRGVRVRADVLAAAAVPLARRARVGHVLGFVAGPDDPDLAAGRARPRRGPVLVGIPGRIGRWAGAGQRHGRVRAGGAVRRSTAPRCSSPRRWCSSACGAARSPRRTRAPSLRFGARGVAPPRLPRGAVLQLRDGVGGVRTADRAGARCSSSRRSAAAPVSRAWRWRRSPSATSRWSSPAVICPTGSGGASYSSSGSPCRRCRRCLVGFTSSLPIFLAAAYVTGAATGIFISPQQAAVADIIGSKARGGTAVATFQMMADLGSIVGRWWSARWPSTRRSAGRSSSAAASSCSRRSVGCSRRRPAVGRPPGTRRPARWARRLAAKCPDLRF